MNYDSEYKYPSKGKSLYSAQVVYSGTKLALMGSS
jgi:hypothetical protein